MTVVHYLNMSEINKIRIIGRRLTYSISCRLGVFFLFYSKSKKGGTPVDFNYFYGRGADQFAFYQIPKILITDEKFAGITMESKILYSLMLDRASFSAKNGWLDEDGKVFIYYKLDRIMADMHCANQKATKMLKELEDKAGLIERQKQGQGKPTKIYVKDFATGLHDYGPDRRIIQTHENHDSETHENHESRNVIITGPDSWKSCIRVIVWMQRLQKIILISQKRLLSF